MKSIKIIQLVIFCIWSHNKIAGQVKSIKYPLSWELQLGSNYLTNSSLSKNYPLQSTKSISGNFYTYVDFQVKSFIFRPGIGVASQNFGLNKLVTKKGGKTTFEDFNNSYNYQYSYLQKMFVEIPLGFIYTTQQNKNHRCYEYEVGFKLGYLLHNESQYLIKKNSNEYSVISESNLQQLNPFQFGTYVKFSSRKIQLTRTLGTSFSISSQYNFSQVFKNDNGTPSQSYSLILGMGLFINRM